MMQAWLWQNMKNTIFFLVLSLFGQKILADDYEDWWPRPQVSHQELIHLVNTKHNCSLKILKKIYPFEWVNLFYGSHDEYFSFLRYPNGGGSSRQLVIGCVPLPSNVTSEYLNIKQFLWQPEIAVLGDVSIKNLSICFWIYYTIICLCISNMYKYHLN